MTFAPPAQQSARIRILGCDPQPTPPPPRRRRPALVIACVLAAVAGFAAALLTRAVFPQKPPAAPIAAPAHDTVGVTGHAMVSGRSPKPHIARLVHGPEPTRWQAAARHERRSDREATIMTSPPASTTTAVPAAATAPVYSASASRPAPAAPAARSTRSPSQTTAGPAPAGPHRPADPTDPNAAVSHP